MAFAFVQQVNASNTASGTTLATAAASTAAGNHLFVHLRWETADTVVSVSDSAGNSYAALTASKDSNGAHSQWFYKLNAAGSASNVVTATWTAAQGYRSIRLMEFSASSPTFEQLVSTQQAAGVGGASFTSSAFNTASAGLVLVGVSTFNADTSATYSAGYTGLASTFNDSKEAYRITTGALTGEAVTYTGTNASTSRTMDIVTLTESGSSALVGAPGAIANVGSTGAVTQTHQLAGAAGAQANAGSTGIVAQTHALVGSAGTVANTGSTGAVAQSHQLAGAAGVVANTGSTGAETQTYVLAGSPGAVANVGSTGAVVQTHVLAGAAGTITNNGSTGALPVSGVLVAAPGAVSNVGSSGAVTQTHVLGGSNSTVINQGSAGAVSIPSDPRYARPSADVSAGPWTPSAGTSLFAMIDEPSADSSDFIQTSSAGTCETALNPVVDPGTSSGQVVRYQAWSPSGVGSLTVRLKQGATVIAEWPLASLPTVPTIYAQALTAAQCDSITNYADLRFEFAAA